MGELEKRLARLEARAAKQLFTEAVSERERRLSRLYDAHLDAWLRGLTPEDISQDERASEVWRRIEQYAPIALAMIWEGVLPGREELIGAGIDFSRAVDASDVVGGRVNPLPPDLERLGNAP